MKRPSQAGTRRDRPLASDRPAPTEPEPVVLLAAAIRAVAGDAVDPEVLIGTLLESAVHVAHRHVPPGRHEVVGWAMRRMLADRLDAYGFADGD